MTSTEFALAVKKNPLVIVPVGSVEEHGSHLPLGTDAFQAEEIARRIGSMFGAIICPPIRYGECRSTRNYPGTLTLSFETVTALTYEIVSELARNGVRRILILTGHAGSGHMVGLRLGALRALEKSPNLRLMVLSDYDLAYDLRGREFPIEDGHGGEIETSRILNIRPDLVRSSRPKGTTRPPEYMVVKDPERYMPTGIYGDSAHGNRKKGKTIDDYVVTRLCELIERNFGMKRV